VSRLTCRVAFVAFWNIPDIFIFKVCNALRVATGACVASNSRYGIEFVTHLHVCFVTHCVWQQASQMHRRLTNWNALWVTCRVVFVTYYMYRVVFVTHLHVCFVTRCVWQQAPQMHRRLTKWNALWVTCRVVFVTCYMYRVVFVTDYMYVSWLIVCVNRRLRYIGV